MLSKGNPMVRGTFLPVRNDVNRPNLNPNVLAYACFSLVRRSLKIINCVNILKY